jgi:hypothetical protein
MKIPESVIEKYQLIPSDHQIGESFMQNQLLFKSALAAFERVLFMECDFMGKPSAYINLFNADNKKSAAVTPEFLINAPVDTILDLVS